MAAENPSRIPVVWSAHITGGEGGIAAPQPRKNCNKLAVKLPSLETFHNGPRMVAVNSWWSLDALDMQAEPRQCKAFRSLT